VEAEDSVLGSMLIEKEAVLTALEILTAEDFYKEQNRIIFRRMAEMAEVPEAVDVVTLSDKLRATGELEKIGGMAELARLANFVPTAANVEYYARIVAEKAIGQAGLSRLLRRSPRRLTGAPKKWTSSWTDPRNSFSRWPDGAATRATCPSRTCLWRPWKNSSIWLRTAVRP
jgi:replicative DNA helicase